MCTELNIKHNCIIYQGIPQRVKSVEEFISESRPNVQRQNKQKSAAFLHSLVMTGTCQRVHTGSLITVFVWSGLRRVSAEAEYRRGSEAGAIFCGRYPPQPQYIFTFLVIIGESINPSTSTGTNEQYWILLKTHNAILNTNDHNHIS